QHVEMRDYESFTLDLLRLLSISAPVSEQEFLEGKADVISDKVFAEAHRYYKNKSNIVTQHTLPFINDVFTKQGATIQNIVVPFTDGMKAIQVMANLKKSYETKGREMVSAFERTVTTAFIDDAWKEHLREMDDLKQSVQNAVYEQKDPLLIYKFESFELFKQMLDRVNKEITSFLFKGVIPQQDPNQVKEAKAPQRTDMSRLNASKADAGAKA